MQQGYKQTEIGVIPEDWEIKRLIDLSNGVQNGVFYEVSRKGNGVFFLNVGNLYETAPVTTRTLEKFNATKNEIKRFKVKHGDLFFTRSSIVPSGIAYCNWYRGEDDEITVFDSHVVRFKTDSEQVVPMYLYLQCISQPSRKYFISNAKVATMTTIDQNQIGNCQIPVPPLAEQQRIAEALSDVDSMISSLEKLITKKKAIKQGTMQELLTGKKRLPGFTGEWDRKTLKEISTEIVDGPFGSNLKTEHYIMERQVRIIQLSNIGEFGWNDENIRYTTFAHAAELTRCIVQPGAVLIAKMMPAGRAIICPDSEKGYILGSDVVKLVPNDSIDSRYLIYATKSQFYLEQIADDTQGSTRSRTSVSKLRKTTILFPSKEEQTAIASILFDMDNEIEALEQKLMKTRQLKQGMMQQLLTGKIRLV